MRKKIIFVLIMVMMVCGCTNKVDNTIVKSPIPTESAIETCNSMDDIDEKNAYCNYANPIYKINDRVITNTKEIKDYDIDGLIKDFGIDQKDLIINRNACDAINEEDPPYGYAGSWVRCDEYNNSFHTFDFDYAISMLEDNMDFEVLHGGYLTDIGIEFKDTKFKDLEEFTKIIPDEVSIESLIDDSYEVHSYRIETINQDRDEGSISISIYTNDEHTIVALNYYKKSLDKPEYSQNSYYGAYRYK